MGNDNLYRIELPEFSQNKQYVEYDKLKEEKLCLIQYCIYIWLQVWP